MTFIRARFFTVCNFSGSQFLSDLGHDNGGIPGSNEKLAPECSYADTEVCYRLDEGLSSMWSTPYGTVPSTGTGTSTGIISVSVSISTFLTCACCTIITILFLFSSIYVRMLSARWLRIEIVRVKYKEADAGTADTQTGNGG